MLDQPPRKTENPTPTLRIQPHRGWVRLDFHELWAYRELLYFFIWRDLKVRYKQTVFGAAWAVLQPLLLMVVFTLFLGRLTNISPGDVPYPLLAFAGLVPWTLFAQSLLRASGSLVDASNLVQKVYFPRLLLPLSAVGSYLFDFVIALGVLALLMLYFGHTPTIAVLLVLPLTALAIGIALALGIWLAAVNVRYRDVKVVVPFLVQLGLFASPVAYSTDLVPTEWRGIFDLNPMAGVIEGFRWALLGVGSVPVGPVITSTVVTIVVLIGGLAYFRRVERTFADVI